MRPSRGSPTGCVAGRTTRWPTCRPVATSSLVDGEGNVVASRPRPGSDVRYQPGNERVDEGALPQAVSADGSVVLEWINLSSWRLVDRSGTELQTIDTTSQVVVSNGFLAYDKPNGGVTVLVPGA